MILRGNDDEADRIIDRLRHTDVEIMSRELQKIAIEEHLAKIRETKQEIEDEIRSRRRQDY